ncbi:MAG: SVM family protein [Candidatus Phytoplasma stylosanthis]|uniref:SVM family protein n=1 Tax=Candidatus Phytoplasma stylosanthis TaxID=2798314 RepID=UPI00293AC9D8|nr:SVM family protein [Candidatus Phytoplasma stylosanthis]MDV3167934.1 SVM family protein [Candidatus Phytoplasma stylosanthis]MDV3171027.1 SVM family protein [Candidatus Phytoplasma stylosanthis]MDV3173912.1 SVM family protein [Candidatus Phytoplasma stylosanthis]MDV3174251.1 SVM family protein [Candidatus Phytoplasma stylosanthis]MDV3202692.1 SVM family protein [Candidatus Phytoplasma stylosanthis]
MLVKNKLHLLPFFLISCLGLLFQMNNNQVMAAPNEEFVGDMRIVNVTLSNINVLKNHEPFLRYFDFTLNYPCYNGNMESFAMIWKIKNPPRNLLGVFFDNGIRDDEDDKYNLEELKQIGNGAHNMYIFWKYEEK